MCDVAVPLRDRLVMEMVVSGVLLGFFVANRCFKLLMGFFWVGALDRPRGQGVRLPI